MMQEGPLPPTLREDFARFLATPELGDVYASPMFPLQRRREAEAIQALAASIEPHVIMEIGADKGGGLLVWLGIPSMRTLIVNEIRGTPYVVELSRAYPGRDFVGLPCSSREPWALDAVRAAGPLDVLFIDGCKASMHDDFLAYLPLVRPGGLILQHDVTDPAPGEQFERSRCHPRVRESFVIHDVSEVQPALDRQAAGIPPAHAHEQWLRHWAGKSCGCGVMWV